MAKETSKSVSFRLPLDQFDELQRRAERADVTYGVLAKEMFLKALQEDEDADGALTDVLAKLEQLNASLKEHRLEFAKTLPLILFDAGNVTEQESQAVLDWVEANLLHEPS